MLGLIGRKKGMTQVFRDNGDIVPVTVIELGPCTVVQKKTIETDGYNALQLGYGIAKQRNMAKPRRGHFEKKSVPLFTYVREFRTDGIEDFKPGEELLVGGFKVGDKVHVRGVTKGRGFQGVIKRHGKHGGPGAHGSNFHRRPGSIGMRTSPARVFKNMKLPGHMGNVAITVKNLEVIDVRTNDNVILIRGAIPGAREGLVEVVPACEKIERRPELKRSGGTSADSSKPETASEKTANNSETVKDAASEGEKKE